MAVTVYAPASMGNVGLGFDVLGAALAPVDGSLLGDSVRVEAADRFAITNIGDYGHLLPREPTDNILYACHEAYRERLQALGLPVHTVAMTLDKGLPIGTGLGSSACSVVASLVALNDFHGSPLASDELLKLMGELEGRISGSVHYDNVAPCYLGGLQLMPESPRQLTTALPWFDDWYFVMAFPGVPISTSKARALLPDSYSKATVIQHARQLATFVQALHTGQKALAAEMIRDLVAEPYRKALIPGFAQMQQAMFELGGLACSISGAGSTCFTLVDDLKRADVMAQWLQQHFVGNEGGFVHICRLDQQGARRR